MWRALYAASSFQRPWGKYVIAVNEDIDPGNTDAVFWAMSYRADPERDTHLLRHQDPGHGPRTASAEDSALLVNATLRRECDATPGRAAIIAARAATWRPRRTRGNGSACRLYAPRRRGDVAPNTPLDGAGDPGAESQES